MARLTVIRAVLLLVVLAAVLLAALWWGQRRLIFFPDRASPVPGAGVREVALQTSDGLRLAAWLATPTGPTGPAEPAGPAGPGRRLAVLVAPGNAGHRGYREPLATRLAAAGFTVLLLDYRGYGGNPGRPGQAGLARDVRAGLAHLGAAGFAPDRIIYLGESLGAAVVAELATEHPPAGLVLRSPFVDLAAVGREHYPWLPVGLLLRDRFPVAEHVARVTVPTVVVYGSADSIVPPEQSRRVARAAGGPVTVVEVPGADHNDAALVDGTPLVDAVVALAGRSR